MNALGLRDILSALVLMIAVTVTVAAQPATDGGSSRAVRHSGDAVFRELGYAAALAAAREEQKPLLACFVAAYSLPCKFLDETTWVEPRVRSLLAERVVAIRVDVEREAALAGRFRVDRTPTLLLLDADERELDCIEGYRTAKLMVDELEGALAGRDAETRARARIEQTRGQDAVARHALANVLVRKGRETEALEQFEWCFDQALPRNIVYASTQRAALFSDWARLAARFAPARDAMQARRAACERVLLEERDEANVARNLAGLAQHLGDTEALVEFYDRLKADSRARGVLIDAVFDRLVDARRYDDILAEIEPRESFRHRVQVARAGGGLACCPVHARRGPGTVGSVVERGARLVEALAATKRDADARALIDDVIRFEDTIATRELLVARLERAERRELADRVRGTGQPGASDR
ncbi:MAG: thioredoxin family protein [Phycisphaerae bacterium]